MPCRTARIKSTERILALKNRQFHAGKDTGGSVSVHSYLSSLTRRIEARQGPLPGRRACQSVFPRGAAVRVKHQGEGRRVEEGSLGHGPTRSMGWQAPSLLPPSPPLPPHLHHDTMPLAPFPSRPTPRIDADLTFFHNYIACGLMRARTSAT